jgi:hypothetical protein
MWMTKCDSNNLVLHLTRIPNMTLPDGSFTSVPKRTTHSKAKHTKEIHTLSTNVTPNRLIIKNDNFSM